VLCPAAAAEETGRGKRKRKAKVVEPLEPTVVDLTEAVGEQPAGAPVLFGPSRACSPFASPFRPLSLLSPSLPSTFLPKQAPRSLQSGRRRRCINSIVGGGLCSGSEEGEGETAGEGGCGGGGGGTCHNQGLRPLARNGWQNVPCGIIVCFA
jgi:hypothetical protein